jgi:fructosamine-3-kinase
MVDWQRVFEILRDNGVAVSVLARPQVIGGGDINAAWSLDTADGPVFLKTAPARDLHRFEAEADGLAELGMAGAIRVPAVLACAASEQDAILALEWLDLERPDRRAEMLLGEQLAALHRCFRERFGWHRDNAIGLTLQINTEDNDWVRFFRRQRLGYQLELAGSKRFGGELQAAGATLTAGMDRLFEHYAPQASLLHGDLWGGNWASMNGLPVVFDPAVYYGDRESDLAMTRLFGGFGDAFYRSYEAAWPLEPGHEERLLLYQLYHVLNHLNLFGNAYLGRALELMRRLNDRF